MALICGDVACARARKLTARMFAVVAVFVEPTIDSDRVMLTLCRARWRLVLQGVGGAPGEETIMRVGHVLPILAVGVACGAGVALASHPQVDPNTVPVGFLTAHSTVNRIPAPVIARAFRSGKADVFIEHARLAANQAVDFHIHPGPSFITVQSGSLRYEEAAGGGCLRKSFGVGRGFVDGPSRHVHRVIAGVSGADYYEVYLLPRRTGPHFTKAPAPPECG